MLKPFNKQQSILAFGDSLTYGYGAEENQSYPAQLSLRLNLNIINAGINGETSEQGLNRLEGLLDKHQPQLLLLCHGANDMLQQLDLDKMKMNVSEMIKMTKQRNIQVLLISVPEISPFLENLSQYSALAIEHQIPLENEIIKSILKTPSLHIDDIHPNAAGYQLIAEVIYQRLIDNKTIS